MKVQRRYKFLRTGYKSNSGDHSWRLGSWYKHNGELELCEAGFHCSKGIWQAFSYVQGEILAEVEVRGNHLEDDDKEVWEEVRVINCYSWTKTDSVLFSIYAARLMLSNFEKEFPEDKKPREAYVKDLPEKNREAAESAWAAVWSAEPAVRSAIHEKLDKWMLSHKKNLKVLKESKK